MSRERNSVKIANGCTEEKHEFNEDDYKLTFVLGRGPRAYSSVKRDAR